MIPFLMRNVAAHLILFGILFCLSLYSCILKSWILLQSFTNTVQTFPYYGFI